MHGPSKGNKPTSNPIQFLQHHNLLSSSTASTSTYCSPLRTQFLHQLHIFIMVSLTLFYFCCQGMWRNARTVLGVKGRWDGQSEGGTTKTRRGVMRFPPFPSLPMDWGRRQNSTKTRVRASTTAAQLDGTSDQQTERTGRTNDTAGTN